MLELLVIKGQKNETSHNEMRPQMFFSLLLYMNYNLNIRIFQKKKMIYNSQSLHDLLIFIVTVFSLPSYDEEIIFLPVTPQKV